MYILLTVIHVVVCLFLIVVVLLQSGKAADLAGAFGGMGSQTVFGPRGSATVLSRATTIAAALFMVTSLTLSIMTMRQGSGSSGGGQLDKKHAPIQAPAAQVPVGGQVPITVTPGVDGKAGAPQTITPTVIPDPTKPNQQKQPEQKK
jgi:preprotein translocase subunit SecG